MKVSGMIRLNTAEYKFILIVVFLNFNLLLLINLNELSSATILCIIYIKYSEIPSSLGITY